MRDRIYVEEVLREWHKQQLEKRLRLRSQLADRLPKPSPPRRLSVLLGKALIRLGMGLYGWGHRCRKEEAAAMLAREEPRIC